MPQPLARKRQKKAGRANPLSPALSIKTVAGFAVTSRRMPDRGCSTRTVRLLRAIRNSTNPVVPARQSASSAGPRGTPIASTATDRKSANRSGGDRAAPPSTRKGSTRSASPPATARRSATASRGWTDAGEARQPRREQARRIGVGNGAAAAQRRSDATPAAGDEQDRAEEATSLFQNSAAPVRLAVEQTSGQLDA